MTRRRRRQKKRMAWTVGGAAGLLMLLVGFPMLLGAGQSVDKPSTTPAIQVENSAALLETQDTAPETIKVFDHTSGSIVEMRLDDYVCGVVSAEMPASYELEALKAQAVAARTLAVKKSTAQGGDGCVKHPGADVCTEFGHCQDYKAADTLKKDWGEAYEAYVAKIQEAVFSTEGQILTYDGRPIQVFYHAVSGGKTEDAQAVFGASYPYLKSVSSTGEEKSQNYDRTLNFTNEKFISTFKKSYGKAKLSSEKLSSQVKILSHTEGGRVDTIELGGVTVKGTDFRTVFDLPSAQFDLSFTDGAVKIHCIGYGHGVGMSQTGANSMAQNGQDYRAILIHYYAGTEISQLN